MEREIKTYRVSTRDLGFGSPNWKLLCHEATAKNIYWFLTDPRGNEAIAMHILKSDLKQFLEIAALITDADFNVEEIK